MNYDTVNLIVLMVLILLTAVCYYFAVKYYETRKSVLTYKEECIKLRDELYKSKKEVKKIYLSPRLYNEQLTSEIRISYSDKEKLKTYGNFDDVIKDVLLEDISKQIPDYWTLTSDENLRDLETVYRASIVIGENANG